MRPPRGCRKREARHFFISFDRDAPLRGRNGVNLSTRLKAQYPKEMTIVLQHQFWDLIVGEDRFEVGLSFGGSPERLLVPFRAITGFADPSVQFGLQFAASGESRMRRGRRTSHDREDRQESRAPAGPPRAHAGIAAGVADARQPCHGGRSGGQAERHADNGRRSGPAGPIQEEIEEAASAERCPTRQPCRGRAVFADACDSLDRGPATPGGYVDARNSGQKPPVCYVKFLRVCPSINAYVGGIDCDGLGSFCEECTFMPVTLTFHFDAQEHDHRQCNPR